MIQFPLNKHIDIEFNNVHVWFANLDVISDALEIYYELLSDDEKKRAGKFHFSKDRNRFIVSRGILRILSGRYLKTDPKKVIYRYGKYGKPELEYTSTINFNISHSGDIVVIGFVKDHEIGVDVEKIKKDIEAKDIAKNCFSPEEIASLEALPENVQSLAFYRCWTRKEAFIKAKGSGLSFPLDSFTVSLDSDERATLIKTNWNPFERSKWKMYSFIPAKNYISAIAVHSKINTVKFFKWEELI